MILYQLHVSPDESQSEGEDRDEWFTSLTEAKRTRAQYIRENPTGEGLPYGEDFQITRVTVNAKLPKRALLLAVLNRFGGDWRAKNEEVMAPYVFREQQSAMTLDGHRSLFKDDES